MAFLGALKKGLEEFLRVERRNPSASFCGFKYVNVNQMETRIENYYQIIHFKLAVLGSRSSFI
jgi:hypothetical protein